MHENQVSFKPDTYYHVFNRAIGRERLFLSHENYRFFIFKYCQYISPVVNTYSYCLLPNHFHFLIRSKTLEELKNAGEDLTGFRNLSGLNQENYSAKVSKQFSNFFNSYAKAFNKKNKRNGSLFARPFKKKEIESTEHLKNAIIYIHQNPIECGLVKQLNDWSFSSYMDILKKNNNIVDSNEVISWFGDLENFIYCNENDLKM